MKESDDVFMTELMTVQSSTLALQDRVDAVRNGDIIKNTTMGSAYAKWLGNVAMGEQYKDLLNSISSQNDDEFDVSDDSQNAEARMSTGKTANGDTVGEALKMCQENQTYYANYRNASGGKSDKKDN